MTNADGLHSLAESCATAVGAACVKNTSRTRKSSHNIHTVTSMIHVEDIGKDQNDPYAWCKQDFTSTTVSCTSTVATTYDDVSLISLGNISDRVRSWSEGYRHVALMQFR